ncbi:MAG TPA: phage holin family protein [Accumulibacter sp.]|uniref:phage holin family protein n=1 Tax=Accumulibacter sp. TaxID=2053492 RepID=UPI002B9F7F0A|nr:phage holin family protein [Accumulibacter sp.]HOG02583.1 phage holin family protein [Accumulibacter sp.]HPU78756.1 phage holin family protein [Accumulibacter sp.]
MSETTGSGGGGLLAAARNSAATLLASGRTRLELLGNEIKAEKLRAVHLLLVSQTVAFCLLVGILLAIALLLVLFWDNRVALLGSFSCLFFVIAGLAYLALKRLTEAPENLFSTSIAELEEDLRRLHDTARK